MESSVFHFLIDMMFLYKYGSSLESGQFAGQTADFLFMIIFSCAMLLIPAYLLGASIMGVSLIMVLIYYWARKNPNLPMSFMFGIRFQSAYFPWVLILLRVLLGGTPLMEILGVIVGHIYFFLQDIYPATSNRRPLLQTPQFLKDWFQQPIREEMRGAGPRQPGYHWGPGNALGQQFN